MRPKRISTALRVTRYRLVLRHLPQPLEGFTILHLSDLHSRELGAGGEELLHALAGLEFDLAALTGDLIDGKKRRYNDVPALRLAGALTPRAPVYYVSGNHEWRSPHGGRLFARLAERGVRHLRNRGELLVHGGRRIGLVGMDDLMYFGRDPARFDAGLRRAVAAVAEADLRILLSHRPELFAVYRRHRIELVLSGHTHGGQVRLPRLGGLFAPGQGLFPPYDAGLFVEDATRMVVSRGLGHSLVPLRINNPPEIVLVELTAPADAGQNNAAAAAAAGRNTNAQAAARNSGARAAERTGGHRDAL